MDREQVKRKLGVMLDRGINGDREEALAIFDFLSEDAELAEWFAREIGFDERLVRLFDSIEVPASLRQDILLVSGEGSYEMDEFDLAMSAAMQQLRPSSGLRESLYAEAVDYARVADSEVDGYKKSGPRGVISYISWGAAAAALLIVGAVVTRLFDQSVVPLGGDGGLVDVSDSERVEVLGEGDELSVEALLAHYEAGFALDLRSEDADELFGFLEKKGAPTPSELLGKLDDLKGFGCREIEIGKHRGSMVCLQVADSGEIVHLYIFEKDSFIENLPRVDSPLMKQVERWAVVQWQCDKKQYMLSSSNLDSMQLAGLL